MRTKEEKMMMHLHLISLKRFKSTDVPVSYVREFVEYCQERGINALAGALSDNYEFQTIYR